VPQPGSQTEPVLAPGHLSLQGQPWLSAQEPTLRPWRQNDAPDLTRAYTDPENHRWHARSMTTAEAASWIQYEADRWNQDRGGSWAITRDDALVGRVGIGGVSLEEARAGGHLPSASRGPATRGGISIAHGSHQVGPRRRGLPPARARPLDAQRDVLPRRQEGGVPARDTP